MQLPPQPTLQDIQVFIAAQCEKRGWNDRSDAERMMLLAEETGEIAKEIRRRTGKFGYKKPETTDSLAEELVDALNYIVDIANSNDIDLDNAFRKKWASIDTRTWNIS